MLRDRTLSCFLSMDRLPVFSSYILYFHSSSPNPTLDRFIHFSTSTAGSGSSRERVKNPILRRALVKQPPTILNRRNLKENSCCFIGTIMSPLRKFNDNIYLHRFRVFTLLKVCNHLSSFRIFLEIQEELAEVAFRQLEREDVIYAWGVLSSYDKIVGGKTQIFHKLIAKKLNYVRMNSSRCQISFDSAIGNERERGERLRLWQLFFASPHEWWDNRGSCKKWGADFRHKDTHESLRLCPDDPEWVNKQLELYDLKMSEMGSANCGGWASII